MFKLVVLSALVAVAVAAPAPGLYHGAPLAYSVGHPVAIPTAVSHSSRVDVHSSPLIATTYTAPAVVAAPLAHAIHAPLLSSAVSHQSRYDIHRSAALIATPIAHGYALPYAHGYAAAAPALTAW